MKIESLLVARRLTKTTDLAQILGVSDETVRRDLEHLEREGKLRRVRGGAVLASSTGVEPSQESRKATSLAEKASIGVAAAGLVDDGDTLFLDLGTTALEVARNLRGMRNITVITNSWPIALELVSDPGIRVIALGGVLRPGELATSGPLALEGARRFHVDKAFIGVGGLNPREGLTDYHLEEAEVRKVMIANARVVIAVADHTKFGVVALASVVDLQRVDKVVTDAGIPKDYAEAIEREGVGLIVA